MPFNLASGHFGDVQVSAAKQYEYSATVRHRLDTLLAEEQRYADRRARHEPRLDPEEWKFVRSQEELQVYRRRRRGRALSTLAAEEDFAGASRAVENGQPSVVALGRVDGCIEDLLYGLSGPTQEEAQTTLAFLDGRARCALLRVLERETLDDPLHFMALKWIVAKSPAAPVVVPRDTCYLEAMGVEHDVNGEKYGYLVLHSLELPECPPFDRKKVNVVRGGWFFSCLFRESVPGVVSLQVRGVFDLGADIPRLAMPFTTTSLMNGLSNAVRCAEAKKLTLLARHHVVSGLNRDPLGQLDTVSKSAVCSVCIKPGGAGFFSDVRSCRVCGVPICSKCSTKKRLFLGSARPCSSVVCCPNCILVAQGMTDVRPTEPEYSVVADFFFKDPLLDELDDEVWMEHDEANRRLSGAAAKKASLTDLLEDEDSAVDDDGEGDGDGDGTSSFAETLREWDSSDFRFSSDETDVDEWEMQRNLQQVGEDDEVESVDLQPVPRSSPQQLETRVTNPATSSSRIEALAEKMMALQSTADQVYAITRANEQMMKRLQC